MSELSDIGEFLIFAKSRGVEMFLVWITAEGKRGLHAWHAGISRLEAKPVDYWKDNWDTLFPTDITTDETARLAQILEDRP